MRTIGLPVRLGIGVLAVTLIHAGGTGLNGGADSSTSRERVDVQVVHAAAITTAAAPGEAVTSAGTPRSGYMVVSGRTGSR